MAMTENLSEEERFALRVAAALDSSLVDLPVQTEQRLNTMRRLAVARTLSRAVDGVPPEIQARLNGIREQALQRAAQQLQKGSPGQHPLAGTSQSGLMAYLLARFRMVFGSAGMGVTAGALASVCLLMTTLAWLNLRESQNVLPLALTEEGLVLASVDDIELYENLEFYEWLAENGLQN